MFFVAPQTSHRKEMSYGAELYAINFMPSFFREKCSGSHLISFLESLKKESQGDEPAWPQIILPPDLRQTMEGFCQLLLNEFSARKVDYEHVIWGIMVSLLSLLARAYHTLPELQEFSQKYETEKKEVLLYIDTLKSKFAEQLTLNSAAKATGISKPMFCKIFLEITGITFNRYLNKLRINHAVNLIISTKLPLASIAEKVGYSDFSTFYRNFVRVMGVSPSECREVYFAQSK